MGNKQNTSYNGGDGYVIYYINRIHQVTMVHDGSTYGTWIYGVLYEDVQRLKETDDLYCKQVV